MAAISKIEIETRKLQNDIDSLKTHLKNLEKKSDEMMEGINSLSAMWEGEAKNAFTDQFRSDYQTMKSMETVISELIQKLEYARENYDTCESNVASIIDSIRV